MAYLVSVDVLENAGYLVIGVLLLSTAKVHLGHANYVEGTDWESAEYLVHVLAPRRNDHSVNSE